MQTKTHTEYTSSDTYVNMHIRSSTNTVASDIMDYISIAVWIRVVPLERWIVANWMRIYHEARAMCEK